MVGKEIAVKKYVVRLSAEEHAQLDELIRKGKRSAQLLTKARILLKADVSELGEGWSDSRIAAALETSIATVERTRRQLVEEGFEAVLRRKYNPNSARPRIFDGAAEAKLIALFLTAISFPTTNHLHRCLAATEIQKLPSFSMTGATSTTFPKFESYQAA